MKIAVLSRNPRLYSTRRLVEAGTERGHQMVVIDTLRAYMNIASHKPQIHYRGKPLEGFDAVIPRIGASVTFYGCAVLRQFEMMGVFPLNESVAIARSRDKLRSLQLLSRRGLGLPVTGFAHSPDDIPDLIEMVNGAPLVIKVLEGTQGIGFVVADNPKIQQEVLVTPGRNAGAKVEANGQQQHAADDGDHHGVECSSGIGVLMIWAGMLLIFGTIVFKILAKLNE